MRKTREELEAYRSIKEELKRNYEQVKENLWYVELMEAGVIIDKDGAFITEDRALFEEIQEHYKNKSMTKYWEKCTNWTVATDFSERYQNQKKFLEEYFLPYLDKEQLICDVGAANGDWSLWFAKYVGYVEGVDYSEAMVKTAQEKAYKEGIKNVCFSQADACTMQFDKQYDNFFMGGGYLHMS